jgi:hypothetical protein
MTLNVYGSPYTCTVLLQGVGLKNPTGSLYSPVGFESFEYRLYVKCCGVEFSSKIK